MQVHIGTSMDTHALAQPIRAMVAEFLGGTHDESFMHPEGKARLWNWTDSFGVPRHLKSHVGENCVGAIVQRDKTNDATWTVVTFTRAEDLTMQHMALHAEAEWEEF
jgi:hypothetical protein